MPAARSSPEACLHHTNVGTKHPGAAPAPEPGEGTSPAHHATPLSEKLTEMGFRPSDADAGLSYCDDDSSKAWLLVYEDEILIVARTKAEVIDELISVFDAHA